MFQCHHPGVHSIKGIILGAKNRRKVSNDDRYLFDNKFKKNRLALSTKFKVWSGILSK